MQGIVKKKIKKKIYKKLFNVNDRFDFKIFIFGSYSSRFIYFWCRWGLNPRSLIQSFETLSVRLIR